MESETTRHKEFQYPDSHFPFYIQRQKGALPLNRPELSELHWHQELQFTLCLKGKLELAIEGQNFLLEENDFVFINRNILHQTLHASKDAEYLIMNFSENIISFQPNSRMDIKYVKPYTYSYQIAGILFNKHQEWHDKMVSYIKDIAELYAQTDLDFLEYRISIRLVQLWLLLCQNLDEDMKLMTQVKLNKHQLQAIQAMIAFIYEHYHEKIELTDIAKSGNVSQTECGRIFKAFTKQSPYHYLIHYRLQRSLDMIARFEHLNITDIASMVGFGQPSSFIHQFTEKYGTTPKQYRLNLQRERRESERIDSH